MVNVSLYYNPLKSLRFINRYGTLSTPFCTPKRKRGVNFSYYILNYKQQVI